MKFGSFLVGRYVHVESPIHSLDPRAKFLGTLLVIISVLLVPNLFFYLLPTILILTLILMSGIKLSVYLRGIRSFWFFLVFAAVVQLVSVRGGVRIFSFITSEGLLSCTFVVLRLVLIILAAEIFSMTTPPLLSARGVESVLSLFGMRKLSYEVGMIMTIAMRFVPILAMEADRILKAQIARGADFEKGKLMDRLKRLLVVVIPLLVSAMRKAEELTVAMEARLYTGEPPKIRYRQLAWSTKDTIFLAFSVLLLCSILVARYL